jgi:hypothetical protein
MKWIRAARWWVVVVALVAASSTASLRQHSPGPSVIEVNTARLIPPIFTTLMAAPPPGPPVVVAGCTGTPVSPAGKLAITMKSLALVNSANTDVSLLAGAATLDFAQNSGATVGSFVNGAVVPDGTYTKLKATMGSTLTVKGSITCAGITYITNGSSVITNPDTVGGAGAAVESNYTINGGVDQAFTLTLPSAVTVTAGNTKEIGLFFNNNAALQLWDISPITGNAPDRKILPGGGGPSKAQ